MRAILVGHGQAERRTPHRANKFSMKWPTMGLSQLPRCLTQLADRSMQFMADVYMKCPECGGRRYRRQVLDVKYRGLDIAEVLDMTAR
ncbi:MAG: hypothetical protein HC938_05985, partial [Nitrospira sp.]|nr:hypothetical protein [Nitrospira sp.]